MKSRVAWVLPILILCLFALTPSAVRASDHADPLHLTDPYSNITGLFIFPKGDQYILVFNVRKSLVGPKPYPLSPYDYVVNIDLTTPVSFAERRGPRPLRRHDRGARETACRRDHHGAPQRRHHAEGHLLHRAEGHRPHPHLYRRARRPLHLSALLQGERHLHGDEHPDGRVSRRAARFHPVGHHRQGRHAARSRRPLGPQPVAALPRAQHVGAERSRQAADEGKEILGRHCQFPERQQGMVVAGDRRSARVHLPDPQIRSGARRDDLHQPFPAGLPQRPAADRRCQRHCLHDRRLPAAGALLHRRRLAARHRQRQAVPRRLALSCRAVAGPGRRRRRRPEASGPMSSPSCCWSRS